MTKMKRPDNEDFMEKVPTATCALRDRSIVSIERVYTPNTFYMKSAVSNIVYHKYHKFLYSWKSIRHVKNACCLG